MVYPGWYVCMPNLRDLEVLDWTYTVPVSFGYSLFLHRATALVARSQLSCHFKDLCGREGCNKYPAIHQGVGLGWCAR
jgi:hypothetical protein